MFKINLSSVKIVLVLMGLFLSGFSIADENYTMPVGIPDAPMDFTQSPPERPSDWSVEVPGYYYVDMVNGSTAQTYGSETLPRKYLPKPIPAGSYVEVAGTYSKAAGGVIPLYVEGTDEEWVANVSGPVWVTSAPNTSSSFTERKIIFWGQNAFLTDVTVKKGSSIQVGSLSEGYPASNIVVRNCEAIGRLESTGAGTILVTVGNENSPTENVVFYNNVGHDSGDISSELDIDTGIMSVSGYCSNVWILDNVGYNAAGSGLQINARPPAVACHNIYVGNNEFYNVRQSGMWVKYATDVVFSTNYIHDIISTPWSPAKGMGAQYEPHGLWMINNHIHGVEYGVRIASTYSTEGDKNIYIIGNIIHDVASVQNPDDVGGSNTWQSAAIHLVGGQHHYIYNNLIYDAPNGIDFSSSGYSEIKNNMIFDLTSGQAEGEYGRSIWSEFQNLNVNLFIANNYFDEHMYIQLKTAKYPTGGATDPVTVLGNQNIRGTQFLSDADVMAILNAGSISGFDLSEVLDQGANVDAILSTEFNSRIPEVFSLGKDMLSNVRTQGAGIDMGPFEQGGAVDMPSPSKAYLRVNYGSGDGYYAAESVVPIVAAVAAEGYEFDAWIGDVASVTDSTSASTTVTVADEDLTLTATYKALSETLYHLTVTNGSGTGDYASGSVVALVADAAPEGQQFDVWTGDTAGIANTASASTTITVADVALAVTATYKAPIGPVYQLTVTNGSGSGDYASGSVVSLVADAAPEGQVFDVWTGDVSAVADSASASTTVTIADEDLVLSASYKNIVVNETPITVERISPPLVIDLDGREFRAFKDEVYGNIDGAPQEIGAPVYTVGEGSVSMITSTDFQFVQDEVEQGSGYAKLKYDEANSVRIPLVGNGDAQVATLYLRAGVWSSSPATFTVTVGEESEVVTLSKGYAHLRYQVRVVFTDSVDVLLTPNGVYGGYAAFSVAGLVLDEPASAPTPQFTLQVNGGSGDGEYTAGTVVNISADAAPDGQVFDAWTGDVEHLVDPDSASTTLTMPGEAVAVTATYQTVSEVYDLTVNSGSGDGEYTAGTVVSISADAAPDGQVFYVWTGDVSTLANASSTTTTVTVDADVTVTATYRDVVSDEPVDVLFVDLQLDEPYSDTYNPETRSSGSGDQVAYNSLAGAAAVAVAGDRVEIRGGTYTQQLVPQNSGTADAPVTYRNYNGEDVVITGATLSPAILINDRSYLIIEGLQILNVRRWMYALNAHHNLIQNNVFDGALDAGNSSKTGLFFQEATFNRLLNNEIHNCTADSLSLIMSDHNLVAGNNFSEAGHTLWAIKGGNRNILRDNYFYNESQKIGEVYDCHDVGFDHEFFVYDATKYNVIEGNVFAKTSTYYSTSGGNGIQYAGQNGIVRHNVFYDNNVGIGMQFYGEEAAHNKHNRIYQNTLYKNHCGGIATSSPGTAEYSDNLFLNNILSENECSTYDDGIQPYQVAYRGDVEGVLFDHNTLYSGTIPDEVIGDWDGAGYTLVGIESAYPGFFMNTLEVDPLFVDATTFDFSLQAASPLVDAGTFLTATTTAGSGRVIPVADAGFFHDGFGIVGEEGDRIQFEGSASPLTIVEVDYENNTLTVDADTNWSLGQGISLAFNGEAPDVGAFETATVASGNEAEMPLGIPPPAFGITESHEMYAGQFYEAGGFDYRDAGNGPYTHYVDKDDVNATDTDNPYGSPETPRLSIPLTMPAGSVVEIHGSGYLPSSDRFKFVSEGTQALPVFLRGYSPDADIIVSKSVHISGEYLIVENLHFYDAGFRIPYDQNGVTAHARHLSIRNNVIEGTGEVSSGGGIKIATRNYDDLVEDIVIYGNEIFNCGKHDHTSQNDSHAVTVGKNAKNIWMLNNHTHHNGGDSIQVAYYSSAPDLISQYIYIGGNDMHDDGENAVDLKGSRDVIVSENKMYNYDGYAGRDDMGVAFVAHSAIEYAVDVWVINNEVYNANLAGLRVTSGCDEVYFVGNSISNIQNAEGKGTAIASWTSRNQYIVNNTIAHTDIGIDYTSGSGDYAVLIENNVISDLSTNKYILLEYSAYIAVSTIDHNLCYHPTLTPSIVGNDTNTLFTSPLFVDLPSNDFRLAAGSPAKDTGKVSTVYQTFFDRYGLDISVDMNGVARPQGSGWDLGAFEFVEDAPLDSDKDGVPDDWEMYYGFNEQDATDAALDFDVDGMSNKQEYIAGTDPTDPQSYLQLTQLEHAGESFTLSFLSQVGREYSVGRKFDLQETDWVIVISGIVGSGEMIQVEDTADEPAQFYRLNVTIQE
ncbi:right-handed parallel beta-helix repeat-containing protein [Kiritimatiellota bacterium B12222]|nr:right-handed parallel beta-helix repeat-containing protein [Kiritimatiellota bacterium B12222]